MRLLPAASPRRSPVPRAVVLAACLCLSVVPAALADGGGGSGGGGGGGGSAGPGACNYYYEWLGKVRFPLQPDPHATYTYVMPSNQAAQDGVGFLVRGEFIHGAWTSWMAYTGKAVPFDVANFVNNPPANTNVPIGPDAGSMDPFVAGQRLLGTPRRFTLLFEPSGYSGPVAPSLDGTPTTTIAATNIKNYPGPASNDGNFWVLANRNYAAFQDLGYNPGGTTKRTFPVTTAVDLKTGKPVDCQKYNQIPDRRQRPATNPPDKLNYGRVPVRLALKNGSFFQTGLGEGNEAQYGPTNPRGLVQFSRPPLLPGADVATIPPPDNCSGYLGTKTDPKRIALIRFPHIANYTNSDGVTRASRYPNPVNPGAPWEAAYESLVMYGTSSGFYLPGDPNTATVADSEFRIDRTGGSTVLLWPRTLNRREQRRAFRYARRHGWAIVRGGTQGRVASANILIRVKASASDYGGSVSKVPCFFGPTSPKVWPDVPVQAGSPYVASGKNMGSAAPQGVTCRSVGDLRAGDCLARLKAYISRTGGTYFAAS